MKWLDQYCFGAMFLAGAIAGVCVGLQLGDMQATDRMEKEAVFRRAGFYGKSGDKVKFYWGPEWAPAPASANESEE